MLILALSPMQHCIPVVVTLWELTECGNSCASHQSQPDCGKETEIESITMPSHNTPLSSTSCRKIWMSCVEKVRRSMRACAPVIAVPAVAPALDAVLLARRVAVAVALAVRALAVPPVLTLLALPALGAWRNTTSAHTTNLRRKLNADNCLRCSAHNHHPPPFTQGRTLPTQHISNDRCICASKHDMACVPRTPLLYTL